MRVEYISYIDKLPVDVSLVNVGEYPIHWHKSLEILFVLKGKINVTIESETYEVEEKEIEIINSEEAHMIFSDDEDNKVLMFHIDLKFFEKFYDDMENIFFYVNSSDEGVQNEEKYDIIRRYLSMVLCELVQRQDDYDEFIEENLIELIYHLINNFHYLMYEKEEIKDNEEQLQRYHRIAKYIYNNYNNKISLQDIAQKEFLSTHYLSHEIKNTMGLSFKDFVNLVRVEESLKLLLDTDMTISDISEEVGFSHSRYYNKHFKKHYNLTPKQYRKKYKIDDKDLEKIKKIQFLEINNETLESISDYLEDYERYNYEEKIIRLNIDMSQNQGDFEHFYKEVIYLGHGHDLLKESFRKYITDIQKNITFQYGKLTKLFSKHLGIFENSEFINFMYLKQVMDFILDLELRPFIVIEKENFEDENLIYMLKAFIKFFTEEYGNYEFKKWRFQIHNSIEEDLKEKIIDLFTNQYSLQLEENLYFENKNINPIYDTSYMLPYIINKIVMKKESVFMKVVDVIQKETSFHSQLFMGDRGMMNGFGIKKPSYYAYYLLSLLGDTLICYGEGYIVTSSGDDYQILLYTYSEELEKLVDIKEFNKKRGSKNVKEKKFFLNITNLYYDYRMTFYEIGEKKGSAFNYWLNLGKPNLIEEDEIELLRKSAFPEIKFNYAKKTNVFHIAPMIDGYGSTLILLRKVQKHPF
ncbi:helix-turn-helix domain-containing protein [Clostridium senegalense]|uniref:helix-turn-helix domain-containing protein n=1 Tax=Clostridium senegalense TaxID=1465809 RepID=UPI001C1122D6|nr:helix-turn-helix domain-containing protein [Clostridium senegalense]MBU5226342.1 helix-turn-helix domain-containing protein [Clostridium senegalense]